MEELLYLIGGIVILLLTLFDFFYTTLSGSGTAYFSKKCVQLTHKVILFLDRKLSRKIFKVSGMLINLTSLAVWVLLIWVGLFLVYSFDPEAILNSSGREATAVERLYFTGYVLSTLGIGNFYPTSPFYEVLTSLFSFFGFVFFSTAMTYLLSVSSAVVYKRSLASSISTLGGSPIEIVKQFRKMDSSFCYHQILNLQQMINQFSTYFRAYPVLHFYHNTDEAVSMSTNITKLDEAVSIMLNNSQFSSFHEELQLLRNSLNQFLKQTKSRFGKSVDQEPDINWYNSKLSEDLLKEGFSADNTLSERRKILTGLLQNENRSWKDVYPSIG